MWDSWQSEQTPGDLRPFAPHPGPTGHSVTSLVPILHLKGSAGTSWCVWPPEQTNTAQSRVEGPSGVPAAEGLILLSPIFSVKKKSVRSGPNYAGAGAREGELDKEDARGVETPCGWPKASRRGSPAGISPTLAGGVSPGHLCGGSLLRVGSERGRRES